MMQNTRITYIYRKLCQDGKVFVNEVAEALNTSPATIRRDLTQMEEMKLVQRFYGGAVLDQMLEREPNMNAKRLINMEAKREIARFAASLVKDSDVIYLDAGTTTEQMIDYLYAKNILVVTQALPIIEKLYQKQIRCLTFGGYVKFNTSIILDDHTLDRISEIRFNKSFLGCNAISPIMGLSTTNEMEAMLKSKVISLSQTTYALADNSKFNTLSDVPFAQIGEVTVIIDQLLDDFDYAPYGKILPCRSK